MDGSWWRVLTTRGPLKKGMANPFSILALRTPINRMKRQKGRTLKDELPRLVGAQLPREISGEITRKNEETEPKQKQHPVVDVTGDGSKD